MECVVRYISPVPGRHCVRDESATDTVLQRDESALSGGSTRASRTTSGIAGRIPRGWILGAWAPIIGAHGSWDRQLGG